MISEGGGRGNKEKGGWLNKENAPPLSGKEMDDSYSCGKKEGGEGSLEQLGEGVKEKGRHTILQKEEKVDDATYGYMSRVSGHHPTRQLYNRGGTLPNKSSCTNCPEPPKCRGKGMKEKGYPSSSN